MNANIRVTVRYDVRDLDSGRKAAGPFDVKKEASKTAKRLGKETGRRFVVCGHGI